MSSTISDVIRKILEIKTAGGYVEYLEAEKDVPGKSFLGLDRETLLSKEELEKMKLELLVEEIRYLNRNRTKTGGAEE